MTLASNSTYSGLTGEAAQHNGKSTKAALSAAEEANGFVPGAPVVAQELNYELNRIENLIPDPSPTARYLWFATDDDGSTQDPAGAGPVDADVGTASRTVSQSSHSEFTVGSGATGPITYTGTDTRVFKVTWNMYVETSTHGWNVAIKKNSTAQPGRMGRDTGSGGFLNDETCVTLTAILSLATNDTVWLELDTGNSGSTTDSQILGVSVTLEEIFTGV